ncbi:MAG: hypothetical protein AABW56_04805 [Nanoarchaeota archaeon]
MKRLLKAFLYVFLLTFLGISLVSVFWEKPDLLTLILVILSLVIVFISTKYMSKDSEDIILFLLVGVTGAFAEVIAIYFGAWRYGKPQLIGIPYWLPLAWGLAAIIIKYVYLEVRSFTKDKLKK